MKPADIFPDRLGCPYCPHPSHKNAPCAEVTHAQYASNGTPIQFTLCGCLDQPWENPVAHLTGVISDVDVERGTITISDAPE